MDGAAPDDSSVAGTLLIGNHDRVPTALRQAADEHKLSPLPNRSDRGLDAARSLEHAMNAAAAIAARQRDNDAKTPVRSPKKQRSDQIQLENITTIVNAEEAAFAWSANRSPSRVPLDDDETMHVVVTPSKSASEMSRERECVALKEVIRLDRDNVLKLTRCIEQSRKVDEQRLVEMEVVNSEHRSMTLELERANDAKKSSEEREGEYKDSIMALKSDVRRLKERQSESTVDEKQVTRLRFENKLFAAQLLQKEAEFKRVSTELGTKQSKVETLNLQLQATTIDAMTRDASKGRVKELEQRFDKLIVMLEEGEKGRQAESQRYQNQLSKNDDEMREIRAMVGEAIAKKQKQHQDSEVVEVVIPSHDKARQEEIEVLRSEIKDMKEQAARQKEKARGNECNPFTMFSECLSP